MTATQAYQQYVAERSDGETLAEGMEQTSEDLWSKSGEHDPDLDWEGLADGLLEDAARWRVEHAAELEDYEELIFDYDWPEGNDSLEWVITAPTTEIISWAETVKAQAEDATEDYE